jgi:HAMP domain-containing protein
MSFESRSTRTRAAALSVVALVVVMSGCSARKGPPADPFEALRTEVDQQVADTSRAAKMKTAVGQLEEAMDELLQLSNEQAKALGTLVGDYDSPRGDFDQLFADYLEKRRPVVERMLAAHLDLKKLATAEEWKRLAKEENEVAARVASQNLHMSLDD